MFERLKHLKFQHNGWEMELINWRHFLFVRDLAIKRFLQSSFLHWGMNKPCRPHFCIDVFVYFFHTIIIWGEACLLLFLDYHHLQLNDSIIHHLYFFINRENFVFTIILLNSRLFIERRASHQIMHIKGTLYPTPSCTCVKFTSCRHTTPSSWTRHFYW